MRAEPPPATNARPSTSGGGEQHLLKPEQAFDFLLGVWSIERDIAGQATMCGTAWVTPVSVDTASYQEEVQVRTAQGVQFRGVQRYRYHRSESGLTILFAETGTLFQQLCFEPHEAEAALIAQAEHRCGKDHYSSRYDLRSSPGGAREVRLSHQVRGPRKHYEVHTSLRPLGSAG